MDGINKSSESKERYNPLPEIVCHFDRSLTMIPAEELVNRGEVAKLLQIKDRSRLNRKSANGFTLLHHAAKENKIEAVEFLLSHGCDINAVDNDGQTALHKAAMFGHAEFVTILLEKGANANKCDNYGNAPLHAAITNGGDVNVIEKLIRKSDISVKNSEGQDALHLAIKYHKIDTIKLILNHQQISVAISDADNEGYTPLLLAVSLGHFDTTEEFLKRQDLGIDISVTTNKGKGIIHLAATTSHANLLALILEIPNALCLINKTDNSSCTPLHDAAKHGSLKQVATLLDRGGLVVSTVDGYSPLHYACVHGHLNVATKLLKRHPFQKELVTNNGDTALHLAATNGHSAIVNLLLDNGAPITHNAQQASFLDIASFKKDSSVALVAVNHERWQECLDLVSPIHPAPIIHLIQTLPDIAQSVMDHSITSAQLHPDDPRYWKKYDFKYLLNELEPERTNTHYPKRNWYQLIFHYLYLVFTIPNENDAHPLKVIKTMVQYQRKNLLVHPLLLTFLNQKWRNYGRLCIQIRASLITLLTILLTALIGFSEPPRPTIADSKVEGNEKPCELNLSLESNEGIPNNLAKLTLAVNFGHAVVLIIQIISYIRLRKVIHWFHTFVELCTVFSTAVFILSNPVDRWLAAVVALLCAWVSLNLFSRYFDVFGLYTIMFYDLLIRITKAILVGIYYIIGFGLILFILIGDVTEYEDPILAVYNTFFAAFGSFNRRILVAKEEKNSFQYRKSTYTIVLLMTVVLTITLVNLLIGISVGSIGNIQKNALLHQAKLKIQLFLELDPNIPRFLKQKIIKKFYKKTKSNSIADRAYDLWNFIVFKFAPESHQSEEDKVKEEKQEDDKQRDMHYRIKQIERQVESLLKHQKLFMEEMRMNYKNNSMEMNLNDHRSSYSTSL